jgi:hypothetical protein
MSDERGEGRNQSLPPSVVRIRRIRLIPIRGLRNRGHPSHSIGLLTPCE